MSSQHYLELPPDLTADIEKDHNKTYRPQLLHHISSLPLLHEFSPHALWIPCTLTLTPLVQFHYRLEGRMVALARSLALSQASSSTQLMSDMGPGTCDIHTEGGGRVVSQFLTKGREAARIWYWQGGRRGPNSRNLSRRHMYTALQDENESGGEIKRLQRSYMDGSSWTASTLGR